MEAIRGKIIDRSGNVLAEDTSSFEVGIIPQDITDQTKAFFFLSESLKTPQERLKKMYKKNLSYPFVPAVVADDIDKSRILEIEELRHSIPWLTVQVKPRRRYLSGKASSHLIGFLGEIDPVELKERQKYGYRIKDYVGKDGIEKTFDAYLRGQSGGMQIEVNNLGQMVRTLSFKEPLNGKDVTLTIDARLQAYIAGLLGNRKGATVVIDPRTGELLALVSSPGYEPLDVETSLTEPGSPHLNRAMAGEYVPGSIFKIVTAACGLEENRLTKIDRFVCTGSLPLGDSLLHCWKLDGHGEVDLERAIKHSCNIFFFRLGLMVGQERLNEWAYRFGLGRSTGIELPDEKKGLIPSSKWKRLHLQQEGWFEGETANLAIGQGYSLITPLQAACMVSVVANGGKFIRPHLVKRIGNQEVSSIKSRYVGCSETTLRIIKEGMVSVVEAPSGTGHRARTKVAKIAGKTGTAQTHIRGRPHAWFVGFAPADNPKIAFCIFMEHGGSGSYVPAELAKSIVEFYL